MVLARFEIPRKGLVKMVRKVRSGILWSLEEATMDRRPSAGAARRELVWSTTDRTFTSEAAAERAVDRLARERGWR